MADVKTDWKPVSPEGEMPPSIGRVRKGIGNF